MTPDEAKKLLSSPSMHYTIGQTTVDIERAFNLMAGTCVVMDANAVDMRQARQHEGTVEFTRTDPDNGKRITERFRYDYFEPGTPEGVKLVTDEVIAASLLVQYANLYRDSKDHEIVFAVRPVGMEKVA